MTLNDAAGDSLTLDGGVTATAPSGKSIAGTITTSNDNVNLGTSATTVTADCTITPGTGTITLAAVTINAGVTLTLGGGLAAPINTGAVSGAAASGDLTIDTTAAVTVASVGPNMGTVTIVNSGGTTFAGAVTAATVMLTDTTGSVTFNGALNATTLTTTAAGYNVVLNGGGTVTNAVNFLNTGGLTIDPSGFTFTGGATKLAGTKSFAGTISSTNADLNFGTAGTVTLTGNTTFNSGTGAITLFDIPGPANFNLVLQGSGADVLGVANLGTGTLNLTLKTGGSVTANGALTAASLTTVGNAYSISLLAGGTVTNAVTFSNTGMVTLGDAAGDSLTLNGGVTATAPASKSIAGAITTSNDNVNLGTSTTTVTADCTVSPGTGTITLAAVTINAGVTLTLGGGLAAPITTGAVSGAAASGNLTINTTAAVTVASVGPNIGTVTVANSGGTTFTGGVTAATVMLTNTAGTITFSGPLTVSGNLDAAAAGFAVSFNAAAGGQASTVSGTATLLNTGIVSYGNNTADSFSATGGLVHTAGSSTLIGTVSTTNTAMTLGVVTVSGACTANTGTGVLTLGNVTINAGMTLTLGTGSATPIGTGSITGGAASILAVNNTTATATVSGAINLGSGTLTITSGTVDVGGNNFTIGTLSNNGVFRLTGAQGTQIITTPDTNSGTVTYYGAAPGNILLGTFFNLEVNGTGTFTLGQPIFVGNPAGGGSVRLASGTIDVGANHQITLYGDWNYPGGLGTFTCRQGMVDFVRPSGTVRVYGDHTWYLFQCLIPGLTIEFEDGKTQTITPVAGARFRIKGIPPDPTTISEPGPWPNSVMLYSINHLDGSYWNFTADSSDAVSEFEYVVLSWSQATPLQITVPAYVLTRFPLQCPGWRHDLLVQATHTEDSDHNGKVDRIFVSVGPTLLNNNFTGLTVTVAGCTLDTPAFTARRRRAVLHHAG